MSVLQERLSPIVLGGHVNREDNVLAMYLNTCLATPICNAIIHQLICIYVYKTMDESTYTIVIQTALQFIFDKPRKHRKLLW